jgi:hypothetical protein
MQTLTIFMQQNDFSLPFCEERLLLAPIDRPPNVVSSDLSDIVLPRLQRHVSDLTGCSPQRPLFNDENHRVDPRGSIEAQRSCSEADLNIPSPPWNDRSPSWKERSPLRALWKWGSGMSNGDAADIISEELKSLEGALDPASRDGAMKDNRSAADLSDSIPACRPNCDTERALHPIRTASDPQVSLITSRLLQHRQHSACPCLVHRCSRSKVNAQVVDYRCPLRRPAMSHGQPM